MTGKSARTADVYQKQKVAMNETKHQGWAPKMIAVPECWMRASKPGILANENANAIKILQLR
jgi:hypothetical protein